MSVVAFSSENQQRGQHVEKRHAGDQLREVVRAMERIPPMITRATATASPMPISHA